MSYTVLYLGCDLDYFDDIQKKYEKILPHTTLKPYSFDYRKANLVELFEFIAKDNVRAVYLDLYHETDQIIEMVCALKNCEFLVDATISTISVTQSSYDRNISLLKSKGFFLNYVKTLDTFDITYHNILLSNKEIDTNHSFAYFKTDEEILLHDQVLIKEFRKNSITIKSSIPFEERKIVPIESKCIGTDNSKIHPSKYMVTKKKSTKSGDRFVNELQFLYVDPIREGDKEKRRDKEVYRDRKVKKAMQEYSYFLAYSDNLKEKEDVESLVIDRDNRLYSDEGYAADLQGFQRLRTYSHLTPEATCDHDVHCIFIKGEFDDLNQVNLVNKCNMSYLKEVTGKLKFQNRNPYIIVFAPGAFFETDFLRMQLGYKNINLVKRPLSLEYIKKIEERLRPHLQETPSEILRIDSKNDIAWASINTDAKLVALSETEMIFTSEKIILPNSLMKIDYPVSASVLIVPHTQKTSRFGGKGSYRAIFVGLSEDKKSNIRQEINSISVKRKTEARKKEMADIEKRKQQILKEREEAENKK